MENHSLVSGAGNAVAADSADKSFLQCVGETVKNGALLPILGCALSAAMPAAHADTMKITPVASQVMAVEVAVSTLQGLGLSKKKMEQFQALSPENQSAAMFFYNGLKTGNADFQKEGMTKIIRLLAFHEENKQGLATLKKTPNARVGLNVMSDTIAELSDPKTYGAILTSPQSPYSGRFATIRDEATKVFAEAKPLQEAARNMDSPELVAAKKREADSEAALATSRATLQTLQTINQTLARK